MNQLVPFTRYASPVIIAATGERAELRFLEFFTAAIRNPHTRRAYRRAGLDIEPLFPAAAEARAIFVAHVLWDDLASGERT
jgi:hypothetical protein